MNSIRVWPAVRAAFLLGLSVGAACAADWTTSDGKVYHDVKLIRLDQDTVTILHKEGGAQIPLAKLSPDLQKRFGYDPELAKIAAQARAQEATENAKALQAEMDKASEMHQAGQEHSGSTDTTATSNDATGPVGNTSAPALTSGSGTHHFMDEIAASASGQKPAADASHHSIDDATQAATPMRRDLSDPAYHTMAHMFYTVKKDGLGPDPTDANHHTIDEATAAANGQK